VEDKVIIRLQIDLPSEVLAQYEKQKPAGQSLEELLSARLISCASHTSERPLYFTDSERAELEKILERRVPSAKDALRHLARLASISVEGIKVNLNPRLIERLKSRCFKHPLGEVVKREVRAGLETYCGMR
jgi:hypothetical protein